MSEFHARLIEIESELIAKEQARKQSLTGSVELPPACSLLLSCIENEIGVKLGDLVPKDWRGWLCYYRKKDQLIVVRGKVFKENSMFGRHRAGLDIAYGQDSITEYLRGFDVSPPQDLDHLLVNFGVGETMRVFLWYGENISPYRLIFEANMEHEPSDELQEAITEACVWILTKPKEVTLKAFLEKQN